MILEHIVFSVAFAIIVGVVVERKWGCVLPIWIIAICAGLPDVDYIIQSITYPISSSISSQFFYVIHGDFHNIVMIIILAIVCAWLLNKYLKINFNNAFICVFLGSAFHVMCDYIVYTQPFCPISPRFSCEIKGIGLFTENGSWHGIGELSIFAAGGIFLMIAIGIMFYYSESKWIDDQASNYEET